ncbi:MAG: DNA mismatch endonuclease Vsr [Victivallaceae bacterium]|jgi:DNA mismatch endonuclease (patch repair protein)
MFYTDRKELMALIKSKNTKPEIIVRKLLFHIGYRYRLHREDLPGKPDITLSKYKTVIWVNGCFWHFHKNCPNGHIPKTNTEFWNTKIVRNVERDKENKLKLKKLGWKVIVIWECEVKNESTLVSKLSRIKTQN